MSGKRWKVDVAGCPCVIELEGSEWVVTFAATTVGRAAKLETAIVRAFGGLVSAAQAEALAASVARAAATRR